MLEKDNNSIIENSNNDAELSIRIYPTLNGKIRKITRRLFLILLLSFIFALFYPLQKILLETQTPTTVTAFRLGFASICGLFLMMVNGLGYGFIHQKSTKTQKTNTNVVVSLAVISLFGNALPFLLLAWGQSKVDAGITSILAAMMPFMTLIIAHFYFSNSRLDISKFVGFAFGFIGVAILFVGELTSSSFSNFSYMMAIIGSALSYAIATVAVRTIDTFVHPIAASFYVTLPGALFFMILSIYGNEVSMASFELSVLIMSGFFGGLTTISVILMFMLVRDAGPAIASLPQYLTPIIALLLAAYWLKEDVPENSIISLLIILLGIFITQSYITRSKFKGFKKP